MNNTTWYLYPEDGHTTEALGREVSPEDVCREVLCGDGGKRDLYRCEWLFVKTAIKMMSTLHLRFSVWKQRGKNPPMRFNVAEVFIGRPNPKVRAMREQLGAQIARKAAQE